MLEPIYPQKMLLLPPFLFLRRITLTPTSPLNSKTKDKGSGTDVSGVDTT